MLRGVLHEAGWRGLYQGFALTLLYSVPKNGAKLLGFDVMARRLRAADPQEQFRT